MYSYSGGNGPTQGLRYKLRLLLYVHAPYWQRSTLSPMPAAAPMHVAVHCDVH